MTSNQVNPELKKFCSKFALSINLLDRQQKAQLSKGVKRLFQAYETTGLWRKSGHESTPFDAVKPFIQELFAYIEDKKWCLNFLMEVELVEVIKCLRVIDFVKDEFFPLYSIQELSSHLLQFHKLLKIHKDYLVKTGLMPGTFEQCMWLDLHVGHLYDTRTTSSTLSHHVLGIESIRVDSFLVPEQPYTWVRFPGNPEDPTDAIYKLGEVLLCEAVSGSANSKIAGYDRASFQHRFTSEDAEKLEAMRLKNFNVRLRIFEKLLAKLAVGEGTNLLEDCLDIFYSEFKASEVDYLLRMDEVCAGKLSDVNRLEPSSSTVMSGGILNLFEVIGQVEHELEAGMVHKLVETIGSTGSEIISSSESELQAFIELQFVSNSKEIRDALSGFYDHQTDARKFWSDLEARLASWLGPDAIVPMILKTRRRYADEFADVIPIVENNVAHSLEAEKSVFPIRNWEKDWYCKCPGGVMFKGKDIQLDPREQDILLFLCKNEDAEVNYDLISELRDNWREQPGQDEGMAEITKKEIRGCISNIRKEIQRNYPEKRFENPIPNKRNGGWRIDRKYFE